MNRVVALQCNEITGTWGPTMSGYSEMPDPAEAGDEVVCR
jgi:hypothetical protein